MQQIICLVIDDIKTSINGNHINITEGDIVINLTKGAAQELVNDLCQIGDIVAPTS